MIKLLYGSIKSRSILIKTNFIDNISIDIDHLLMPNSSTLI